MEADTATRYRSRILREMNANRENPFNSPPSSTGSHRAGSPTLSSVFSDPEGESTRRLNEDIARVTARKLPVNWEAAHRKWPEFYSLPKKAQAPIFDDPTDTQPLIELSKENKDPAPAQLPFIAKYLHQDDQDTTHDAWGGSNRTRAEMQPRVDNESDLSSILSKSPAALATAALNKNLRVPSPLSKSHTVESPKQVFVSKERRGSISEALERLRRVSSSPKAPRQQDPDQSSPNMSSAKSSLTAVPPSPSMASPGHDTSHARSFFMPDVTHLGDFVTGTLRFTGSLQNGVPILVKHGKVHDQGVRPFGARHAEVDGVALPQDEEKIFVSMDMIRDEIVSLQDHHDKIQDYAAGLQQEVESLEAQLKAHKSFDGRFAVERANEQVLAQKRELEAQVASLQARLDQANQRISKSAIENDTLSEDRDKLFTRLQEACDNAIKLQKRLGAVEGQLESSSKHLASSEHTQKENDTLRRDLANLKRGAESLESEKASLRADNESLRQELKHLRVEVESLRSDNNSLRTDHQSLLAENRSLRTSNKALMEDDDDIRENVDGLQHELDAAREEIERLRKELRTVGQEKSALREDNDSLVRHNEKYFNENKILRRENSGFERSIHDLHDEILKLKEEVTFLKGQLDHCRPIPREDLTAPMDEETEDNMTSAFFVPDITMTSNETVPIESIETNGAAKNLESAALDEDTTNERGRETRIPTNRDGSARSDKREARSQSKSKGKAAQAKSSQGHKVAFALPENKKLGSKAFSPQANQGSKRKSASKSMLTDLDPFSENDDTSGLLSMDNTTQDQAISLNLTLQNNREARELKSSQPAETSSQTHQPQRGSAQSTKPAKKATGGDALTQGSCRTFDKNSCPALSNNARRVLDSLSGHVCQNCIVCSRITSHCGVASAAELAAGSKRVKINRPIPVSERQKESEDATTRPTQHPGHALALVIKGLEDESKHLQMEITRLQGAYNGADKSHSRGRRSALAEEIQILMKRMEVKNDQIYSLYDVLEGQKVAGQQMTEEEIELTVLNITGMTVRDVTGGSEVTWEGIMDA